MVTFCEGAALVSIGSSFAPGAGAGGTCGKAASPPIGGVIGGTEFAAKSGRDAPLAGSGPAGSAGAPASAGHAAEAHTEAVKRRAKRRRKGRSVGMNGRNFFD